MVQRRADGSRDREPDGSERESAGDVEFTQLPLLDLGDPVDSGSACGLMDANRAVRTCERWEEMKHPSATWSDPGQAEESLRRLRDEYVAFLKGRAEAASPGTIDKYG